MIRNTLTVAAAVAGLGAGAQAGLLTMTASSATGADAWGGLSGYTLVLTIDSDDLDAPGSSNVFTLNSWDFRAFDDGGTLVFSATGDDKEFSTPGGGTTVFEALIDLTGANITVNALDPVANYVAFTYQFMNGQSLSDAIEDSSTSGTSYGELILGTNGGGGGDLIGSYAVPGPGAFALLGVAALAARRRRA
jgi:MYXO-CTERM domain-containing protein